MGFTVLPGYPTKWGNKNVEVIDWNGDTYYQGGVGISGGEPFPASNFGWGGFDAGFGCISISGIYMAEIRFKGSGAQQTAYIMVFDTATGSEVPMGTDLSAETFRITFIGV